MSVIEFRKPEGPKPPDAGEELLIFICRCGCSSFEIRSDGTTECCNCGALPNKHDQDTGWMEQLPPTTQAKEAPENGTRIVTRIGSAASALKNVVDDASVDTTVAVIVLHEDGRTRTWGSEDWHDDPNVPWLDAHLATARDMLTNDATRSPLSDVLCRVNDERTHAIVVIDKDGGVDLWAADLIETPEQRRWMERRFDDVIKTLSGIPVEGLATGDDEPELDLGDTGVGAPPNDGDVQ